MLARFHDSVFAPAAGAIVFTVKYQGQTVTGLVGSSVNFTWSFSGHVDMVTWGLKEDGINYIAANGALVSLDKSGSITLSGPPAYNGRVSGSLSGDSSSGQATFTLSSITRDDERSFGCQIDPADPLNDNSVFDPVQLVVHELPQISLSSVPPSYDEGSSVNISCTASGKPEPDVKWMKNTIMNSSGKRAAFLTFISIKRADDGLYICEANNSVGNDVSHVTLVVHYPATIQEAITTTVESWIGQTVTLKCVSDGVPSPTLTWYKPDGSQISSSTATEYTVNVKMSDDQDFGNYKCNANNGLTPADDKIVNIKQIRVPTTAEIYDLPSEIKEDTITLKWMEPQNNGKEITMYTVYQRIVTDGKPGEWRELKTITNVSVRELKVKLEKGKEYEFVVTATNELGESFKEDGKIKRVKTLEDINVGDKQSHGTAGSSCDKEKIILHAVYVSLIILLLIINLILGVVIWKIRRRSVISKTNHRRNICTGCGGELIALNPMETKKESSSMFPSGESTTYEVPSTGDYMPLHPSTRSWEINREQVEIIKVIGKGAFSQVAKATAWNISGNEEYITVAVKMLKANAPDSDRKDLLAEVELIKKLKPHPHVIKLIGCVTDTDPLLVLIEYVPFGDLLGYLRKSRGLNDSYFKYPDVKPQTNLTAEQLMKFSWQVADGMFYLSSRKIIHRDLAARNVLVGEGEKCKVTDFGMARNVHKDDIYTKQSRGRLPVKWTAYEALLYGTYTTQSDVWSYGVLLYEILTIGGSPYPGINARQISRKLQEGFRMPKPKHVDNKLYQIMLKCWEENPSDRPTFAKLKDKMKEMERNHKTYVNLKQYDNSLYANMEDLTAE